MACFNNKEAKTAYFKQYCERCTNWKNSADGSGPGCLISELHAEYCGGEDWRILDRFIPESHNDQGATYMQCAMFNEKSSATSAK